MTLVAGYYTTLNTLFGPLLWLPPILSELVLVAIITFIITLFYRYMIDQSVVRGIKQQIKELQAKVKELEKTNPEAAKAHISEMLKLSNQHMRLSMKPMLPTMLLILAVFPWMASVYSNFVPALPFKSWLLSAIAAIIPPWLLWYILLSIPLSQLFRKALGVE